MDPFRMRDKSERNELGEKISLLNRRVRELETLNRTASLIGSTMEVEKILKIVVDEAVSLTESDQGSISIIRPEAPSGMTTIIRGEQSELRGITHSVDQSLCGWVLENKKPLLVEDLSKDDRFPGFRGKGCEIKSVLSAPLRVKDHIIGVITLYNIRENAAFTEDDVRFVSILSSQSAHVIEGARLLEKVCRENVLLKKEVGGRYQFKNIIGRSPAMRSVFTLLERGVSSEANVVLQGESGTGKELVAKAIHVNGPRREGRFVPVECGAIPDNLLESELFGHVKGAFTGAVKDKAGLFQEANGGTLFLDEISTMDLNLQAKLLRVLQEREVRPVGATIPKKVDVRIISASIENLRDLVALGSFREDLFFRLNVVTLNVPPLRHRKEDIPLLANHFLGRFQNPTGTKRRKFSPETMRLLELYSWPGNVRELENVVERAVTLASSEEEEIGPKHLPDDIFPKGNVLPFQTDQHTLKNLLREVKRRAIVDALERHKYNKTKAAEALGISRQGLIKMLKEIHISEELSKK